MHRLPAPRSPPLSSHHHGQNFRRPHYPCKIRSSTLCIYTDRSLKVAIIFPPAAAAFLTGCSCDLLINICLTLYTFLYFYQLSFLKISILTVSVTFPAISTRFGLSTRRCRPRSAMELEVSNVRHVCYSLSRLQLNTLVQTSATDSTNHTLRLRAH